MEGTTPAQIKPVRSKIPEPGKSFEEDTVNWSLTREEVKRMKKG